MKLNELNPAIVIFFAVCFSIFVGAVAGTLMSSTIDNYDTNDYEPNIRLVAEYDEQNQEYKISYMGNYRGDAVYLSSEVTVSYNGEVEQWNGETRGNSGAIGVGSTHTVNVSEGANSITVTVEHPEYKKLTTEFEIR